jgi:hypothetical protein
MSLIMPQGNHRILVSHIKIGTQSICLRKTTMLLQPPDQVIIMMFKSNDTPKSFHSILDASDEKTFVHVNECWKSYYVADSIANIGRSTQELKFTIPMNAERSLHLRQSVTSRDFPTSKAK